MKKFVYFTLGTGLGFYVGAKLGISAGYDLAVLDKAPEDITTSNTTQE